VPIAFFPKAEALTPEFVRSLVSGAGVPTKPLKGELLTMWLKFGVAPSGELTRIDEVVRGKTQPSLSLLRRLPHSEKGFCQRTSLRTH
jgi:hypothetical protein